MTARGGLPRAGWAALGVAGAAAGTATGLPVAAVLVPGLLAVAAGTGGLRQLRTSWRTALVAAGIGAVLLGVRVLVGPAAPPIAALPRDDGPWRAVVESTGSPRGGEQIARLRLETGQGGVVVAASLPAYPAVTAGTLVEVDGRLRPPPTDDPYGEYLRRTGASGSLDARELRIVATAPVALQVFRDGAGDALQLALPEPEAGLAAGILIGLRERVDRTLAAEFSTAGVSHVVAISGWNIAIVAGLVGAMVRGRPRRFVTLAVLGTVAAYVVAAGASPSVVRAAVMAGVVLLARETGRAGRAAAALGAAVVVLLLVDPALIQDAGFRLSVLATAGLLAWANPIAERLARTGGGRMPRWLAESLGISLAAQAATLPDVLATFSRLSVVAPVVNLAVVPLVPVAMAGGVLALVGGAMAMLGAPAIVATVAGLPGWLVLHLVVLIVRVGAAIPFAAVTLPEDVAAPAGIAAAVALLAAPVLGVRLRRVRAGRRTAPGTTVSRPSPFRRPTRSRLTPVHRGALVASAIVVAISVAALGDAATRGTRLTVLDVGQGDAILLETRTGARMLIDGGPDPERILLALDERIPPWDRRLDVVILTHPHEDHVAGLARVLERYRVGRAYEPGMRGPGPGWSAWDAALRDGPPRGILATGGRIRLGEVSLTVLWPDRGSVPLTPPDSGTAINNVSIVLLGEVGRDRFLLAGDIEQDIDPALLARGLPRVDVLKVAHHGSRTATTAAFVAALRPSVAIASAGAGNTYGHPAPSTLARLRDVGARMYRTDRDGSVTIELDEPGLRVTASGARQTTSTRPRPAVAAASHAMPTASAGPTGYDRRDVDPRSARGRLPASLPRSASLVPAARVRRGGRGGMARGEDGCRRPAGGPGDDRGRGIAPRRRQAAGSQFVRGHAARRRLGGLARAARARGPCARGP